VPTQLFQGSLLLGTLTRAVLGDRAMSGAEVSESKGSLTLLAHLLALSTVLLPCSEACRAGKGAQPV
jgi:hypothetical protein